MTARSTGAAAASSGSTSASAAASGWKSRSARSSARIADSIEIVPIRRHNVTRLSQIAWLAGVLEAEGSFLMSGRAIAIVANMTDRDIVERIAHLLGGTLHDVPHNNPRRLPVWRAQVTGRAAAGWMMTLYPLLGHRRRSQVRS